MQRNPKALAHRPRPIHLRLMERRRLHNKHVLHRMVVLPTVLSLHHLGKYRPRSQTPLTFLQSAEAAGKNPWRPREHWNSFEPMLISEGAFAAGMIFRLVKQQTHLQFSAGADNRLFLLNA